MTPATEVELKLRLPRSALGALREHPALRAARRGRLHRETLAATYFDTPDLALARSGIALRVRRERAGWVQAVKGRGTTAGGLAQRTEDEWNLGRSERRPPLDLALLARTPLGHAAARATRGQMIRPAFATTIVRTTLPLLFADGTTAIAAIDVGRARSAGARRGSTAICELELELERGDVARLFELARALCADLPLAVEPRSKAQRGYALIVPAAATPSHAMAPDFPLDASVGTALAAILRNALAQIEGNAEGVATADDPEWIHQMRVGLRRLRSALALARPLAGDDALRAVTEEVRWIADVLGQARDLDVFAGETLPPLTAAAVSAKAALTAFAEDVRRHLAQARADVRVAVRSPRFQRLLLSLGALAASVRACSDAASAQGFARDALRRRHKQLVRAGAALTGGSPDERHRARIAAKKLRYAAEFFAALFPGRQSVAYRHALSGLQGVLGRLNDATSAVAIAAAAGGAGSPIAALVTGWAAARGAGEERALRRAWRRFRAAKTYWTDAPGG